MSEKYSVGQKVWFVPATGRLLPAREMTITYVRTKWVELDGGYMKFDMNTRQAYSGRGELWNGTVYLSKAEYEEEVERKKALDKLTVRLRYQKIPPSLEAIHKAAEVLGVDLDSVVPGSC